MAFQEVHGDTLQLQPATWIMIKLNVRAFCKVPSLEVDSVVVAGFLSAQAGQGRKHRLNQLRDIESIKAGLT